MPSTHYRRIKDGRQAYHHPPVPLPDPAPTPRPFPRWLLPVVCAAIVLMVIGALLTRG